MPDVLTDLARLLKKMRLEQGLGCAELARKAGLPVDEILAYEVDPTALDEQTAIAVLRALPPDSDDDALLDWPDDSAEPPPAVIAQMEARMLELEAALRIDEKRFRDALTCLDRALSLNPGRRQIGRLLISKAAVLGELSRETRALELLQEAERCLDAAAQPRLWLRLRLEQLHLLCQAGRYEESEGKLAEALDLAARVGRDRDRWQVRCLAGRIATGLGRREEAVTALLPVRAELLATRRSFEAAAVGLDLAGLLAGQGKLPAVAELAREMEPLTEETKLPHAARSTLKVFCWAVRRGSFTAEMGQRLAAEFRRTDSRLTRPYVIPGT